jgi:hypothetical protein
MKRSPMWFPMRKKKRSPRKKRTRPKSRPSKII